MSLPALYQLTREYQEAYETLADLNLPEEVMHDTLEVANDASDVLSLLLDLTLQSFERIVHHFFRQIQVCQSFVCFLV